MYFFKIIKLLSTFFSFLPHLLFFFIFSFSYLYNAFSVDIKELSQYSPRKTTVIYDNEKNRLSNLFYKEHRLYVPFDEIPPILVTSVLRKEDISFYHHPGICVKSIMRAALRDIFDMHFTQGGSTITQQLVKTKLLSRDKRIVRKLKEVFASLTLEQKLTKNEILEYYLNEISYGNNYLGVKTAAQGYFHKELSSLSLKEIAMLTIIPNAPSFYNPLRHYRRVSEKANKSLFKMYEAKEILEVEYLAAIKEMPRVYKSSLTQNILPFVSREVIFRLGGEIEGIKTNGYKIYTTIDPIVQKKVDDSILALCNKERMSILVIDKKTGGILALSDTKKHRFGLRFPSFLFDTAKDYAYFSRGNTLFPPYLVESVKDKKGDLVYVSESSIYRDRLKLDNVWKSYMIHIHKKEENSFTWWEKDGSVYYYLSGVYREIVVRSKGVKLKKEDIKKLLLSLL